MDYEYGENSMIRDSAGNLLEELGWQVFMAQSNEKFGDTLDPTQGYFGRKDRHEAVLTKYIEGALRNLNPWISDKAVGDVITKLHSKLSTDSLMKINEEKYYLLRDGVKVEFVNAHRLSAYSEQSFYSPQRV